MCGSRKYPYPHHKEILEISEGSGGQRPRKFPRGYPASSWFLLHQMREKPLWATVYFSIEHARVRHVAIDAFDVNFICQLQSKQVKHRVPLTSGLISLLQIWFQQPFQWSVRRMNNANLKSSLSSELEFRLEYCWLPVPGRRENFTGLLICIICHNLSNNGHFILL